METLALAQEYIQNGLSVIPLHSRTKIPLLNSWESYQRRLASNEQSEEWFSNGHAENNIAIVTGKISRIIVFDIDGEEAITRFNRAVESLDDGLKTALKYTLCIKTGSGNTNIVIGLRQEEFASSDDKITNSVLWSSMLSLKSRPGKAWTKSTGKELGNITIMSSVNLQTEHLSSPMDG